MAAYDSPTPNSFIISHSAPPNPFLWVCVFVLLLSPEVAAANRTLRYVCVWSGFGCSEAYQGSFTCKAHDWPVVFRSVPRGSCRSDIKLCAIRERNWGFCHWRSHSSSCIIAFYSTHFHQLNYRSFHLSEIKLEQWILTTKTRYCRDLTRCRNLSTVCFSFCRLTDKVWEIISDAYVFLGYAAFSPSRNQLRFMTAACMSLPKSLPSQDSVRGGRGWGVGRIPCRNHFIDT